MLEREVIANIRKASVNYTGARALSELRRVLASHDALQDRVDALQARCREGESAPRSDS